VLTSSFYISLFSSKAINKSLTFFFFLLPLYPYLLFKYLKSKNKYKGNKKKKKVRDLLVALLEDKEI